MRALLLGALLVLGGCATTKNNFVPVAQQISFPALNTVVEARIGEEMVKQGTYTEVPGIYLPEANNIQNFLFSKGFYPQIGQDEKYTYHGYQMGTGLNGYGGLTITGGIFGPMVNDALSLRAARDGSEICADRPLGRVCDTEHKFERIVRKDVGERDFQQTLIYSGRIGDRIKVGYREFSGGMARAAFSNEAEYDLSASKQIAYRGAKIEIISADNQSIKYRVLSNFNSAN